MKFTGQRHFITFGAAALSLFLALSLSAADAKTTKPAKAPKPVKPPKGFTALFNGLDLDGWRGGTTFDHRKLLEMSEADRRAQIAKWTATLTQVNAKTGKPHWYTENGELVNDGFGDYATTEKDYGDFELQLDYKTVPLADSGIYLRGVPQVQIWDHTEKAKFNLGADKGSGGLWNNNAGSPGKDPLVMADKPFGQWNHFRVIMVGSRVSVWLNNKLVVDHAILENYYDKGSKDPVIRNNPRPVPARGPIELQTHGGEIRWRNVFIREIGSEEANKILESHNNKGFAKVFNGRNWDGWMGPIDNYEIKDGAVFCKPHKGGTIYTIDAYVDFQARVKFKLPPAGNNGLAIRYPAHGDTAYVGMCEVQVLDDTASVYNKLDPRQYCGSIYGQVAAHRGYLRPLGDWNFYDVTVKGTVINVELNGVPIINQADVSKVTEYMANSKHPGAKNEYGHFGFAGHNDPVAFKDVYIKRLP